MHGIIRIIIYGGHRALLVEAFDEHSLVVHVGKAHRTHHGRHAALAPPLGHSLGKRIYYGSVVRKVHKSETHHTLAEAAVGVAVDNRRDASGRTPVAVGHEALRLAHFRRRISPRIERGEFVYHQRRHKAAVATVQIYAEAHVAKQFATRGFKRFYCYSVCHNHGFTGRADSHASTTTITVRKAITMK